MELTYEIKDMIRDRAERDAEFGEALQREAAKCASNGEQALSGAIRRDYLDERRK